MRAALLVPVKSLDNAKQRLGNAYDQHHRTLLAEAMLRDVLIAVTGVTGRVAVFLVTSDARAEALANEFGFGVIEDRRNESETAAIEMATAWCQSRGYDTTLVEDAHTSGDRTPWGAPPPDQVIAHTNMYWRSQTAPGRSAGTVKAGDVDFLAGP